MKRYEIQNLITKAMGDVVAQVTPDHDHLRRVARAMLRQTAAILIPMGVSAPSFAIFAIEAFKDEAKAIEAKKFPTPNLFPSLVVPQDEKEIN